MLEDLIISKAKEGDRVAQKQLYVKYKRGWFSICLRYNNNRADAEDVLQNALVKIFSKMDQFDHNKAKFITWSSKIVVNENLQFLKQKMKFQNFDDLSTSFLVEEPEKEMNRFDSEEITAMIQKLPIGYRTVFNLYILEGYTHQEISEILNITIGTSKSQLSKSKQMLRKKIEVLL